jgi:hypothetical protein
LALNGNALSGSLPSTFSRLSRPGRLDLGDNKLTGTLPGFITLAAASPATASATGALLAALALHSRYWGGRPLAVSCVVWTVIDLNVPASALRLLKLARKFLVSTQLLHDLQVGVRARIGRSLGLGVLGRGRVRRLMHATFLCAGIGADIGRFGRRRQPFPPNRCQRNFLGVWLTRSLLQLALLCQSLVGKLD